MSDPSQVLAFAVVPPSIDVSTAANPQVFSAQFGIVNLNTEDTISVARALLQVPVSSAGTNLCDNTDMIPSADTPHWNLRAAAQSDPGYAAFELMPDDGVGAIAPGGSVAFTLSGLRVAAIAGRVALQLDVMTPQAHWRSTAEIELTTPSTTPTITRYSVLAADPRKETTLQGQSVTIGWTSSGAAYCTVEDDQGNVWPNLATSGTFTDLPTPGDAQFNRHVGHYYEKSYTLTASSAGALQVDQKSNIAIVRLPTIFNMSLTPTSIDPSEPLALSWSIANIGAETGKIVLATVPQDGSPGTQATFTPDQRSTIVPAPTQPVDYVLTVDNGYGTPATEKLPVQTPLPSGWAEVSSLETLPALYLGNAPGLPQLAAFGGKLWCGLPNYLNPLASLYWTDDGKTWTQAATQGLPSGNGRPSLDGLIAADLGQGPMLWAFGNAPDDSTPYVAKSADGIHWQVQPRPPYPRRWGGGYLATPNGLLVMGNAMYEGGEMQDVWSSKDGAAWTRIGTALPSPSALAAVAAFAGKLYAVITQGSTSSYVSADGGATWSRQAQLVNYNWGVGRLLPIGDRLYLLSNPIMAMDATGAWSEVAIAPLTDSTGGMLSAVPCWDHLWVAQVNINPASGSLNYPPQFFMLEQVIPGGTVASQSWGGSS